MTTIIAFLDEKTLRNQARKHIEQGVLTANYYANRFDVLRLLNKALVAIDSYRGLLLALGNQDPITRLLLHGILTAVENHANQLADLLEGLPSSY